MSLSSRARRSSHLDDVLRLRALYGRRGPLDGQTGLTPDGLISQPIRWRVASVMDDANAAMGLSIGDHARWRAAMGMDDEPIHAVPTVRPEERDTWQDQCPSRGPGLTHARTKNDPAGVCAHCRQEIRWKRV